MTGGTAEAGLPTVETVDEFRAFGITAFTTGRAAGSFSMASSDPARDVAARWDRLRDGLAAVGVRRLATSHQVHGHAIHAHQPGWEGWLRAEPADGHVVVDRGTALAVSVADCVPVFLAHPSGAVGALHSGWRGTAGRIVERGIATLAHRGLAPSEVRVHLGPAICGGCYEVSADVYGQLTGRSVDRPTTVDLRALIAGHARAAGVRHVTVSDRCTRCDHALLFSHRGGDAGRQLAVVFGEPVSAADLAGL